MTEKLTYISLLPSETCDGCNVLSLFAEHLAKYGSTTSIPFILKCANAQGSKGMGKGPARKMTYFFKHPSFINFLPLNTGSTVIEVDHLGRQGSDMVCPRNLEHAP